MTTTTNNAKRTPALSVLVTPDMNSPLNPGSLVDVTFADDSRITLQLGDLSDEVLAQAVLHGLKQKLVDAAAIGRNPDTGRSATLADKKAAVMTVYNRLLEGSWNAPRGEGGMGSGGLLFRALCRLYSAKTPEQIREFLEGKDKTAQAALRKNPKVAAIIEELKAESDDTGDVDTDDLLNELED